MNIERQSRHSFLLTIALSLLPLVATAQDERAPELPCEIRPLVAQFTGANGVLLTDGADGFLIDGFFSRYPAEQVSDGMIAPDETAIETFMDRAGVVRLRAVMASNTTFDHALDSAVLTVRTGATAVGSESLANIARGFAMPADRFRIVRAGEVLEYGDFRITVLPTPPDANPDGIAEPLKVPAAASSYRRGETYAFLIEHQGQTVLVYNNANFTRGALQEVRADVVFLGIGGISRQGESFLRDYWREVVQTTGAQMVIPTGWDDIYAPLDLPLEKMVTATEDVNKTIGWLNQAAASDRVTVYFPAELEPFGLGH